MVWLVRLPDGKILGPLSTEDILQEINRGEFSGEEMLSEYPSGKWKPLAQEPHLYDELLKALEDAERQVDSLPEDLLEAEGDSGNNGEREDLHGSEGRHLPPPDSHKNLSPEFEKQEASFSSPHQAKVQGKVIDLKKKNESQKKKPKKKNIIFPTLLCLLAVSFLFLGQEEESKKNLSQGIDLIVPREDQPQISEKQALQKRQKALTYFLLDTRFGYSKAQNLLVQVAEGTKRNVDAYSWLCVTYLELWPYVEQNTQNLKAVSQVTQWATALDPVGVRGSTCRVVKLIIDGEYKKAKLVTESILNKFGSSNEIPTLFYYFKALLLINQKKDVTAVGYLNSAQKLWPSWLRLYSLEATTRVHLKQYDWGAKLLHQIIKANPNHMEARIRLGRVEYLFYKRRERTKIIITDALKINDQVSDVLMSNAYSTLAEVLLQENRKKEALEAARKSYNWNSSNQMAKAVLTQLGEEDKVTNKPLNDQQLVYQGDQFLRFSDCNSAQAHYKSAYESNPKNSVAAMKAAKCLWSLSFSLEAIEWLNKAIVADPNLIEAYIHLANYYSQRYDYLSAMQILSKAQAKAPRSYEIYKGYALIEKRRGNYPGAINFAKQALNLYEADIESLILLSEAYMKMENFREAYVFATKALEIDNANREAQISYGKSLLGIQGADASISYLSDLVSKFPLVVEYRLALGDVFMEDERYSMAAQVYRQTSQIEEKSKRAFLGLGLALDAQHEFNEALDALLQAAILDPADPEALFRVGLIYFKSAKFNDAENQFLRVLKINERYPWVHYYLGQIDLKRDDPKAALRRSEEERRINPRSPASYLLSAEAYMAQEKYSLCGREYQKAIRMSSQGSETYVKLARCYRQSGSMDVAKSMLNQAKVLESGNPNIYRELGAIYESEGKLDMAFSAYRKYLNLAPNAPDARQIRGKIKDLSL